MYRLSKPSRLVLVLAGLALAQTVADSVVMRSVSTRAQARTEVEMSAALANPARDRSPLDSLRNAASLGDTFAESQLVAQLLDSYDRSDDSEELLEAMQWMDRHWDSGDYQQSGLATRVFNRYCGHRVLKWHWLCNAGE